MEGGVASGKSDSCSGRVCPQCAGWAPHFQERNFLTEGPEGTWAGCWLSLASPNTMTT